MKKNVLCINKIGISGVEKKASQVISPEFDFQMEYFQTLETVILTSTSVR